MDFGLLVVLGIIVLIIFMGVKIVPQQQVWVVERLGKMHAQLDAGMHVILPIVDKVAYKHTLKERAVDITEQSAITRDNVSVRIDGIIYVRIINPIDASYGVENPYYAVSQLAQTSMRSAIGKITLDKTFEERESLNAEIVQTINEAAKTWGIQCMRYEIKDINPPQNVLKAMELQVAAERQKRAAILESEGKMQAQINVAEADKRQTVLQSEAVMTEQANKAKGEAEAIMLVAKATAERIKLIAEAINVNGGSNAVSLKIAENYIDAFKDIASQSNTLIIPANANDASGMVAQALSIFESLKSKPKQSKTGE